MIKRLRPRSRQGPTILHADAGFGLLEAIVALAVFASAGMALFAWINTNLANAARLQEFEISSRLSAIATEWVQTLNPVERGRGEVMLEEGLRLRWDSRQITPRTDTAPFPGGQSTPFDLALFQVQVYLSHPRLEHELEVDLRRVGVWREPYLAPDAPEMR